MDEQCTRLYLLRHGETENYRGIFKFNGQNDVDVTALGKEQLGRQARLLKGKLVKAVYCSDLVRTRKGAQAVASVLGLEITTNKRLREIHAGHWEAMPADEVKAKFPGEFEKRYEDIVNYRIPGGGENLLDVKKRAMMAISEIVSLHRGEEVAVVAHGGVNRVILCDAMGLELDNLLRIEQDFGCLNIIDYYDGMAVVKLVNLRSDLHQL